MLLFSNVNLKLGFGIVVGELEVETLLEVFQIY